MNTLGNLYTASLAFFGGIGIPEVVVILFFMLLLFGGKKLPELARGMGRGLRHFKEEVHGLKSEVSDAVDLDTPPEPPEPPEPKADDEAKDEKAKAESNKD